MLIQNAEHKYATNINDCLISVFKFTLYILSTNKVLWYLHDGFFIWKQVTKQRDISLTKGSLVGDETALSAGFGQHHRLSHFAHLLQVFYSHLHEALALQADVRINW